MNRDHYSSETSTLRSTGVYTFGLSLIEAKPQYLWATNFAYQNDIFQISVKSQKIFKNMRFLNEFYENTQKIFQGVTRVFNDPEICDVKFTVGDDDNQSLDFN